ncbi:MAG: GGDEF domain-containing protein [Sulfuricurvum sp.]|nr:GGDEF domain-containing protein [Sulfuricurvum sp.]
MNKNKIYDKIISIHDQVISLLSSLHIPPYPTHYKKYFDQLFLEQASHELKKSQRDEIINDRDDLSKYLHIAQETINAFTEAHSDISYVAKVQENLLNQYSPNGIEHCMSLVNTLSELGNNMSVELKKAQEKINFLNLELKETISQLTTDPLTQISNRKSLIDDLELAIKAGKSKQLPMVLMMIDGDNFKTINDDHGHVAGDKVLYFLAQSIKSIIRTGDNVYRYGGEEFTVVLNRCDSEQAIVVAEKIRAKVEHSHLIYSGKTISVTVSIGVTIHHQDDTYDDLIERADEALYRAKKAGKNKTIMIK